MESLRRRKLRLAGNAAVFVISGTAAFLASGSGVLRPEWISGNTPENSTAHDPKRQHAEFEQIQRAAMQTEAETEKRLAFLQTAAERVPSEEYPAAVRSALSWPTREREAFLSTIARRWAATDSQAACAFFAALESADLRATITGVALETWASTAPKGALDWLRTQPESVLRAELLNRLIKLTEEHDPAVALAALNLVPEKPSDRDRRRELALRLAATDPRAAALAILKADSLTQPDRKALRKIAERYVQADYSETSAWLKTLNRNKATELRYALGHAWGGLNPHAALEWTKQFDEGWRPYLASCAVAGWAEKDPASARAYVAALPPGSERELLMGTLIHTLGVDRKDIAAIVSLSRERTPAGDGALRDQITDLMRDGAFNHRTVAEALRALPQEDRNRELLDSFLASWAEKNPAEAADYMGANGLAAENPQAAAAVTKAFAGLDPEQAIGWAMQLPGGEARENAVSTALRQLAATDAVRAWSLCEANLPSARQREVATSVAGALADRDPASAAEWAGRLSDQTVRAHALESIASAWAQNNPQDCIAWLGTLEAGPVRDCAVQGYVTQVTYQDPRSALTLAASIGDPEQRLKHLTDVANAWYSKNSREAVLWINSTDLLSPSTKQWLFSTHYAE